MTPDDQPTSPDPAANDDRTPGSDAASAPTRRTLRAAERTRRLAAERAARLEQDAAARADAAARDDAAEGLAPLPAAPGDDPAARPGAPRETVPDGSSTGAASTDGPPAEDGAGSAASRRQDRDASAPEPVAPLGPEDAMGAGHNEPIAQLLSDDHEPLDHAVRAPAARRRGPRVGTIVIVLAALLAVGGALGLGWSVFGDRVVALLGGSSNDYEGTGNGTKVDFAILDGDTGTDIGERLADADIVKSSEAFVDAVLAMPEEPQFQPGAYRLELQQSASSALTALLDDANRMEGTVVIPEGTVMADVFTRIEDELGIPVADLQAAAADPQSYGLPAEATSLEGFLFPATYTFETGTDAKTVLTTMVDRMFQALDEHGVPEADRWSTVVLASLVQKEARIDEDFAKVARVFLNRVDEGMNLQSDATVAYGTGNTHRVSTTDAEREDAGNPYNTYVHPGLPVGPISNPGDVAIDAALHPADGTWLYFVTWNLDTGETIFSTTYEEHEAAVDKWLKWMDEHPEYG